MRFRVVGARRTDGAEASITIDAQDEQEATWIANNDGIVVASIAPIDSDDGNTVLLFGKGHNGQVTLRRKRLTISRRGFGAFLHHGTGKGDKDIRLGAITSVQLKKPGLTAGYIQFVFSGGSESHGGTRKAASDEDSVTFYNAKQYSVFQRMRDLIYDLQEQHQSPATAPAPPPAVPPSSLSIVDELEKLAKLRESGALDDSEFAAAKRRLLNG